MFHLHKIVLCLLTSTTHSFLHKEARNWSLMYALHCLCHHYHNHLTSRSGRDAKNRYGIIYKRWEWVIPCSKWYPQSVFTCSKQNMLYATKLTYILCAYLALVISGHPCCSYHRPLRDPHISDCAWQNHALDHYFGISQQWLQILVMTFYLPCWPLCM